MIENLTTVREQSLNRDYPSQEFENGDPRKLRPLSLEQQKKRARELLNELQASLPDALTRFHRYSNPSKNKTRPRLLDAQRTIARELGFKKWEALKAHIESSEIEHSAMESEHPIRLDGDKKTLHIRCGSDIKQKLSHAGFQGDFLHFLDVYVHGPVPQTPTQEGFFNASVVMQIK